jgi:hypothetical protein
VVSCSHSPAARSHRTGPHANGPTPTRTSISHRTPADTVRSWSRSYTITRTGISSPLTFLDTSPTRAAVAAFFPVPSAVPASYDSTTHPTPQRHTWRATPQLAAKWVRTTARPKVLPTHEARHIRHHTPTHSHSSHRNGFGSTPVSTDTLPPHLLVLICLFISVVL